MKYKILFLIGLLVFLTAIPVAADEMSVPTLPAQITGTLYNHEGKPFPVGTVITAEVNGVTSTYTITEAGKIGGSGMFDPKFLVSGVTAGDTVSFSISGSTETVTMEYNPDTSGQVAQMAVVIPIEIPETTANPGGNGGGAIAAQPTQPIPTQTETAPTQSAPSETVPTNTYPTQTPAKSPLGMIGIMASLGVACAVIRKS